MAKRVGRSKDLSARQADIMRALFERSTEQHGAGLVRHVGRPLDRHPFATQHGWVGDFTAHRSNALPKPAGFLATGKPRIASLVHLFQICQTVRR